MIEHLHRFEFVGQLHFVDRKFTFEIENTKVVAAVQLHELTEASHTMQTN